jgi:acetyl-CoA acetyltransferase/uncharacterized OB-fold protein
MIARPRPAPSEAGAYFWQGAQSRELRIGWCEECACLCHPALELCPACLTPIDGYRAVSGRATVLAVTVNHQPFVPGIAPPYAIAIVALAEDTSIRLTTNIVDADPEALAPGMAVQVVYVGEGEEARPCFEPAPLTSPTASLLLDAPCIATPALGSGQRFEERVALTGIGSSRIERRSPHAPLQLVVDACTLAIADAGLERSDIDGLCGYPGSTGLPGLSSGGVRAVEQVLRLNPVWHCGAHEVPGQIGTVVDAMLAVSSGLCRHVLCFTSFSQRQRPIATVGSDGTVHGEPAWYVPFGCTSPANWLALYASQYCARYGVDPAFLGHFAISARAHAARNPQAHYRDPLDMDAYLASRMISSPLRLLDCDLPCDGAMAVIISAVDAAQELRHHPVLVEAAGTKIGEVQSWDQGTLTHQPQVFSAAAHMWSRTGLTPADVDVALLYDGFSFNAVSWIEAMSFCGPGETPDFIAGGTMIGPGGGLPLNPHGGHLCAGRTNGYGHLLEAIVQLRGHGGDRQVNDARVAVVSTGGAIPAGCLLLRAE